MTISLPHLWMIGHLAALVGASCAVVHLFRRLRFVVVYGAVTGLASCGALAYILQDIGQSFFGAYRRLAWLVAFFAGYAVGSVLFGAGRLAACAFHHRSAAAPAVRT